MTTARDIITLALHDAGVYGTGQTPGATDINNGLTRLQNMVSQWKRKRWLIFHLLDVSAPMDGSQSYTIGTGQTLNTPRPDRIESAFIRQITPVQPNQPDWPLEIVESREAYSTITLKKLGSLPRYLWYDAAFPNGLLYPWPLPSNLYELHVQIKDQLQSFATLDEVFNLPAEYLEALQYNLQVRFLAAYRLPPDPQLNQLAANALNTIKNANAQIAVLRMPRDITRPGLYNVFSDNTN